MDAPAIDSTTQRCDPAAPFKAPVALASLESARDDIAARPSPDELTIVFARINADMTYDLYSSTRARDHRRLRRGDAGRWAGGRRHHRGPDVGLARWLSPLR